MSNLINNNRKEGDNRKGKNARNERSYYLNLQLKATKDESGYKEGRGHCGKCQFWDVGNSCLIVEGEVDADDGCRFYKAANL